jgi:ribosomal protein L37E
VANVDGKYRHPCRRCARPIYARGQDTCKRCLHSDRVTRRQQAADVAADRRSEGKGINVNITPEDYDNPPEFRHDNYQ